MKLFLFISILFFLSTTGWAQINFNDVVYGGTGCRRGTVSTIVTPDGLSLSVLFDKFSAQIPQHDGDNDNHELPRGPRGPVRTTPSVSHRICSLSFTATLPAGTKADSIEITMQSRGAIMFDIGIEGHFMTVLAGIKGLSQLNGNPVVVAKKEFRSWSTPIDRNWTERNRSVVNLNSACSGPQGRNIRFALRNNILVKSTNDSHSSHGLIIVDSTDINGLLKFTLRTRPCGGGRMSP